MATVNAGAVRAQVAHFEAQWEATQNRQLSAAVRLTLAMVQLQAMMALIKFVLVPVFEKITPKTAETSGLPPARDQSDLKDEKSDPSGSKGQGSTANDEKSDHFRTEVTTETSDVHNCDHCGHDLSDVAVSGTEERVTYDIVFVTTKHTVTVDIKMCPQCETQKTGVFPDHMPGPRQYRPGLVAFVVTVLSAYMRSLKRTADFVSVLTRQR